MRGVHCGKQSQNVRPAPGRPTQGTKYPLQYANRRWISSGQTIGTASWVGRKNVTDSDESCGTTRQRGFPTGQPWSDASAGDATRLHKSARKSIPSLGFRIDIRTNCQRASRLVRQNGVVECLAREVRPKRVWLKGVATRAGTTCAKGRRDSRGKSAGSLRPGRGGATGITLRARATSASSVGQSDSAPLARRICAIWRKHSC